MLFFRKLLLLLVATVLLLLGLWLVIMNEQRISLDLFGIIVPPTNTGFIVIAAFCAGAVLGLLLGSSLLRLLQLNNRLYWLRREVRQLQDELLEKTRY